MRLFEDPTFPLPNSPPPPCFIGCAPGFSFRRPLTKGISLSTPCPPFWFKHFPLFPFSKPFLSGRAWCVFFFPPRGQLTHLYRDPFLSSVFPIPPSNPEKSASPSPPLFFRYSIPDPGALPSPRNDSSSHPPPRLPCSPPNSPPFFPRALDWVLGPRHLTPTFSAATLPVDIVWVMVLVPFRWSVLFHP